MPIFFLIAFIISLGWAAPGWAREASLEELKQIEGEIYYLSAGVGEATGIQVDSESNKEAELMRVAVNRPGRPVILFIAGPKTSIWHLGWSEGSRIAAVVGRGAAAPVLVGLPDEVPVLHIPPEPDKNGRPKKDPKPGEAVKTLMDREATGVISTQNGYITVGDHIRRDQRLVTGAAFDPERVRLPGTPLTGDEGLYEAIRKGWLKPAIKFDTLTCSEKAEPVSPKPTLAHGKYKVYDPYFGQSVHGYLVISDDFVYPAGSFDLPHFTLYIAEGLSGPKKGSTRVSSVIFLSDCAQSPKWGNAPPQGDSTGAVRPGTDLTTD